MRVKILSIFLLLATLYSSCNQKNFIDNRSFTVSVLDTIRMIVPKPNIGQQAIAIIEQGDDFCSYTERDFYWYYETSYDSSFNASYLSVIRDGKITYNEKGKITYDNLSKRFSELNQLKLYDLIPINEDSSIVVTENDFFHLLVGDSVLLSKPFHEVFNTEQYYYVSYDHAFKNATPIRFGNNLLISFGGDEPNKDKHSLDFKIFGFLNIKDLSFEILDFKNPSLSLEMDRFFSPAYLNLSKIKDDVYLRFGPDSTLYSVIKNRNNLSLKGFSNKDMELVDSLKTACENPLLAKFFINPRWSNLFALEHLQIYCVVGFVPSDFKVKQSRINLGFKSFIDIYDSNFNFIERIPISSNNTLMPPVFEAYDKLYFLCNDTTDQSTENDSLRLKTFVNFKIESN